MTYEIGIEVGSALKEYSGTVLDEGQVLETKAETAALCLYMVLGIASRHLKTGDRDIFIKSLMEEVTNDLAVHGVDREYFSNLTAKRIDEYWNYQESVPEVNETEKDNPMWKFSNILSKTLSIGESKFFNMIVSTFLLKQLDQGNIGDLLAG